MNNPQNIPIKRAVALTICAGIGIVSWIMARNFLMANPITAITSMVAIGLASHCTTGNNALQETAYHISALGAILVPFTTLPIWAGVLCSFGIFGISAAAYFLYSYNEMSVQKIALIGISTVIGCLAACMIVPQIVACFTVGCSAIPIIGALAKASVSIGAPALLLPILAVMGVVATEIIIEH